MQVDGDREGLSTRLLEPGDHFGDYTVVRLLGKGGMGAVYLVHASDGARYAVKVMDPDAAQKNPDFRKRFLREGDFAVKIRHPNLIPVHCVGEDRETGLCYLVMDYMSGGSLADRLNKRGRLPIEEAVSIIAQIADALEVAHRHGVIHRDIKPDNIMFDAAGTPKLADLGVAKFTDGENKTTVTTTGMIIGTPAYMAPEQMMDSRHIDARADIYALGVVLYEMLAGKHPHEGSTAVELLAKAIKGERLPDVRTLRPEISAAVAYVLSLMCAPKPDGRPASARTAAELLHKAALGRLVLPKNPASAAKGEVGMARRKRLPVLIGIVAAASLCLALATVFLRTPTGEEEKTALPQKSSIQIVTNVVAREVVKTSIIEKAVQSRVATKVEERTGRFLNPPDKHAIAQTEPQGGVDRFRTSSPGHVIKATPHAKFQKETVRDGVTQKSTTRKVSGKTAQKAISSATKQPIDTPRATYISGTASPIDRPRVVVLPFKVINDKITVSGQDFSMKSASEIFVAALNASLVKTHCFTMLDGEYDTEFVEELNRQNTESSVMDVIRRSKRFGETDYLINGEMRFGPIEIKHITIKGQKMGRVDVEAVIVCRVCFASTGVVESARVARVRASSKWHALSEVTNFLNVELESSLSQAVQDVCNNIVNDICPMRVAAKTTFELVLSHGGKDVREGEIYDVYCQGEEIRDAMTGEVLAAPEKKVATIRIKRSSPRISYAVVIDGLPIEQIPVGATIRRQEVQVAF